MSHFFLYEKQEVINKVSIENVFEKMGLSEKIEFEFDLFNCVLYKKVESDYFNYVSLKEDHYLKSAFVVGTFLYKKFGFEESLNKATEDYLKGEFDFKSCKGHFVLVFISGDKVEFCTDSLGVFRIFSIGSKLFSTSFLALAHSGQGKFTINRYALYERISCGFITAPDTILNEVIDLTFDYGQHRNAFILSNKIGAVLPGNESVEMQVRHLEDYFETVQNAVGNRSSILGLSSGFDSRLIAALAKRIPRLNFFTHKTGNVHKKDLAISKQIASELNKTLEVLETKNPLYISLNEQEELLSQLIYYYDGRSSINSGAFSETGTFNYNYYHLKSKLLGLNGKGGEILRNHYNFKNGNYEFRNWYEALVLFPFFHETFRKNIRDEILKFIEDKAKRRVNRKGKVWSKWEIQRYYSEVIQSDGEGSIVVAHNKITYYLAPFLDANLLRECYKSFKSSSSGFKFQSSVINRLSHSLAKIESSYGFAFSNPSSKQLIFKYIKGLMPLKLKLRQKKKEQKDENILALDLTKKTVTYLSDRFPEVNWEETMVNSIQRNVVFNTAFLIKHFEQREII